MRLNPKRKGMIIVPEIEIRKGESFESAMRRFKRKIEQEGILREVRNRKHYEKPSEKKRRKLKQRI
jgi:small subunit ribosomal protein S21